MNEPYISRQITVYQTDKKLIEFLDKLKSASVEHYAHLHADSERTEDGRRRISCIGVTMLDYSGGTGDSKITARAPAKTTTQAARRKPVINLGLGSRPWLLPVRAHPHQRDVLQLHRG